MQKEVKYLDLRIGQWSLKAAIAGADDDAWVAVRPLADALGLDWKTQHRKLQNNPQFSCGHMTMTAADGKNYEMLCIPVRQVGGWLYSTNARRVKPELRDRLIAFQQNLQVVIHDAITGRLTTDRVQFLERALAEALSAIKTLSEENAMLREDLHTLAHKVESLAVGVQRTEKAEAQAAATRMAHQRYIKRDRGQLQ